MSWSTLEMQSDKEKWAKRIRNKKAIFQKWKNSSQKVLFRFLKVQFQLGTKNVDDARNCQNKPSAFPSAVAGDSLNNSTLFEVEQMTQNSVGYNCEKIPPGNYINLLPFLLHFHSTITCVWNTIEMWLYYPVANYKMLQKLFYFILTVNFTMVLFWNNKNILFFNESVRIIYNVFSSQPLWLHSNINHSHQEVCTKGNPVEATLQIIEELEDTLEIR